MQLDRFKKIERDVFNRSIKKYRNKKKMVNLEWL